MRKHGRSLQAPSAIRRRSQASSRRSTVSACESRFMKSPFGMDRAEVRGLAGTGLTGRTSGRRKPRSLRAGPRTALRGRRVAPAARPVTRPRTQGRAGAGHPGRRDPQECSAAFAADDAHRLAWRVETRIVGPGMKQVSKRHTLEELRRALASVKRVPRNSEERANPAFRTLADLLEEEMHGRIGRGRRRGAE
jgi:hypothetical protein